MKTFDFISDPGHGWLKVPHRLLAELAIADQITTYSTAEANSLISRKIATIPHSKPP